MIGLSDAPVAPPLSAHLNFIDRETYAGLKDSHHALSINAFKNLCAKDSEVNRRLSVSSQSYLALLNERVNYVLFGTGVFFAHADLHNEVFLREQLKASLEQECEESSSFYEILLIDNENILVVVGNGFLHHLTQSKDALQKYVLACLGCLDRFKCVSLPLNELYLRLLYIEGYHLLIKARAQS
jgi:hypothetical protein